MEILLEYFNQTYQIANRYPFLYVVILFVLCKLISISPLKLDPWAWMGKIVKKWLRWIGGICSSGVLERLDEIDKHLKDVEKENDERRIKDLRQEILDFGDAIRHRVYNHEMYDSIYEKHDEYMALLNKYQEKNGKVDRVMALIDEKYREHSVDEDF